MARVTTNEDHLRPDSLRGGGRQGAPLRCAERAAKKCGAPLTAASLPNLVAKTKLYGFLFSGGTANRSTLVTSQLPIARWHEYLVETTGADALLDRLLQNAFKIELKGESMRKNKPPLT